VQDDWRVTPQLTLNLGLRYDWQSILDDRNNFGPRLGFAYNLRGNGDTVIRGGVGAYYDQPFYHGYVQNFLLNGVNAPTYTYTIAAGDPAFPQFPNSLPAPPAGASLPRRELFLRGENLRSPYTTQESFGIQQRIAGGWVATADVIHHFSVKQLQPYDINAASPFPRTAPGRIRSVAEADRTRPFTSFQGAPVRLFNGSNFYRLNNVYGNGATPLPTFLRPVAGVTNVDPGRQFQFGLRMIF